MIQLVGQNKPKKVRDSRNPITESYIHVAAVMLVDNLMNVPEVNAFLQWTKMAIFHGEL